MPEITLVIGNKNYSSWSLRPWLLLRHLRIGFDELQILLDRPETAHALATHSPSRRVPVLRHGALVIWDSMAIGEYVCELAGAGLPSRARRARWTARSVPRCMPSFQRCASSGR